MGDTAELSQLQLESSSQLDLKDFQPTQDEDLSFFGMPLCRLRVSLSYLDAPSYHIHHHEY